MHSANYYQHIQINLRDENKNQFVIYIITYYTYLHDSKKIILRSSELTIDVLRIDFRFSKS